VKSADWTRRLDALDPQRSCLVKAPAGSGKTELLTARYLSLLAEGGPGGGPCRPGQILAVTFTDKAAVEMRSRIAHWLARAAEPGYEPAPGSDWEVEILGRARRALEAHRADPTLLKNPTAYRVGTFHSFCASVCRSWPVASGIPVSSDILPQHLQESALRSAVQTLLADLRRRPLADPHRQAFERRLAALGNSLRRLTSQLAALLRERHKLTQFRVAAGAGAEVSEGAIEAFLRDFLAPIRDCFLAPGSFRNALAAGEVPEDGEPLPEEPPGDTPDSVPAWSRVARCLLTKGRELRADCRRTFECGEDLALLTERLRLFYDLDPSPASRRPDLQALEDYLLLSGRALEHLRPLIPGGGLDYLELELGARRALRNAEGVPSESLIFFHEHLRHILVDEAQDMNRAQLDLLGFLTEGWEPDDAGNPRTVFVVGDPKQSIYRFRRAEVALFEELAEIGIRRDGSEGPLPFSRCLELESNFRSAPGLVAFANALFARVMADPDRAQDEVPFGPGKAERGESPFAPELRLAFFADAKKSKPRKKKGEEAEAVVAVPPELPADRREARWVSAQVARLHALRPQETIGILLPRRTRLDAYVAALRAEGVPVKMVEGENLGAKPEVMHLHNLFRALARPYDDLAWAGVLRAPWCRVGEAALYALAASGQGAGDWRERLRASEIPEVSHLWGPLSSALIDFGREPFSATLRRAWETLDGPEAVAARYGTQGVGNCLEYFELLGQCEALPAEEALALVEYRFEEAYTPPDPAAASSPVQLMTIHRAKGLEFDHVFAAYLGYTPGRGDGRDQPPFLLLDLPDGWGQRVPCAAAERDSRAEGKCLPHALLGAVDRLRDRAETKRLLYVAATRAKRSLTLSGCGKIDREVPLGPKQSPLNLVLSALPTLGAQFPDLLLLNPDHGEPPSPAPVPAPLAWQEPAPPPLQAFPLPYTTKSPSERLDPEEDQAKAGGEDERTEEGDGTAATVGKVVHRLLERLAKGGAGTALPPVESVAAALRTEGLSALEAERLAPTLLAEARAAWDDSGFVALRAGGTLHPEWALEHMIPRGSEESATVMTGRLDLVIERADAVVIVDYKTGRRPAGKDPGAFKSEMVEHYGHQLSRYEEMLGALPAFAGKRVTSRLLLTDLPTDRMV